jgi:hypothetical protein
MAGDVPHDHRQLTVLEREHVVEVAARPRARGRLVGHRSADRPEPGGRHGQQRGLQETDVLEEIQPLALETMGSQRRHSRAHGQRHRQHEQRRDQQPHGRGHHADDPRDRGCERRRIARPCSLAGAQLARSADGLR